MSSIKIEVDGKELEAQGYEFMGVNSKPKKNPQFVCLKEKQLHFIVVRYIAYPNNPNGYDKELLAKVKDQGLKFEAKTYYAGVGLSNAANQRLPVYLNENYIIEYEGLIEI